MEFVLIFIIGAVFGSFLNVVILRIPKNENVAFPASHCPACKEKLKPYHNIPIISWIFLKGKCGYCDKKISLQYPLVEISSGLLFVLLYVKFQSFEIPVIFIAFSFLMLFALSLIDLKYKMIPDSLNLLAIFFAIFGAWNINGILLNLQNAFLFAGGFTLLRFAMSYYLTSKLRLKMSKTKTSWNRHYDRVFMIEALGEGDIMVAATMGALLGAKLTFVAIFFSAILALPVLLIVQNKSQEEQRVPYVPFLAISTLIVFIFDSPIMRYIEANY